MTWGVRYLQEGTRSSTMFGAVLRSAPVPLVADLGCPLLG
jgi:hypothetical protein